MGKSLLILGAGRHGQVVYELASLDKTYETIYFLDDYCSDKFIIGKLCDLEHYCSSFDCIFPAFGDNVARLKILNKLLCTGVFVPILKHPNTYISRTSKLGSGCIVEAQAVINIGAELDIGCIIGPGTIIEHYSKLGKCVHADCGAIIKTENRIEDCTYIAPGKIIL